MGCVLVALVVRYFATPLVGNQVPFLGFVVAALVAASYGGAIAGVVALFLGLLLGDWLFTPSQGAVALPHSAGRLEFILSTAFVGIILIEILHRARIRVERVAAELRREIARRQQFEEALLQAKAQISAHAAELETRVAERTAKLEATLHSLQDVLYHIAHDLRAPLRAMCGFTEALVDDCAPNLDARGRDYAQRVRAAAERMDVLIKDLLDYGRLGHLEIVLSPVDLDRAMQRALSGLSRVIKSKEARIQLDGPLPPVLANKTMLDRVLANLLDNALKFVAPGVIPRLHIWAELSSAESIPCVRLWIEDNGVGIAPEHYERIFQVFERLHDQNAYEGTGIGLAIVSQGMQQMKGRVGVKSDGVGSRFWIELPTAQRVSAAS